MCYINCVALSFHPHFLLLHFPPPALSCRYLHSCIFHPCLFLLFRADISTPAFSTPAFSVPLELEDPKSWPNWPLTVLALASKWSDLGLDASASSHRSVINVLNL